MEESKANELIFLFKRNGQESVEHFPLRYKVLPCSKLHQVSMGRD